MCTAPGTAKFPSVLATRVVFPLALRPPRCFRSISSVNKSPSTFVFTFSIAHPPEKGTQKILLHMTRQTSPNRTDKAHCRLIPFLELHFPCRLASAPLEL